VVALFQEIISEQAEHLVEVGVEREAEVAEAVAVVGQEAERGAERVADPAADRAGDRLDRYTGRRHTSRGCDFRQRRKG
jgi:hypothetical protein